VEAFVIGAFSSPEAAGRSTFGMIVMALLIAVVVWLVVRRRPVPFWQLVAVVVPTYVVLRALLVLAVLSA
jgi:hypothetical protein